MRDTRKGQVKQSVVTKRPIDMTLRIGRKTEETKKRIRDWSSKKEHRVDALALRAEERRDKLR